MKRQISHPGEAKSEVLKTIPRACIDETAAVEFLEKQRWGDTPTCPHCGDTDVSQVMTEDRQARNRRFLWRCHECKRQFTVRVGTIMEDSRIPLRHWCFAFWSACSSKKGVSALQISRECSLSYRSALFLMHRIRWAMAPGNYRPKKKRFKGIVEVDETYVGAKPRNRHGPGVKAGRGTKKTPVVAIIERGGSVRTRVIAHVTAKNLKGEIEAAVDKSAARLCTDDFKSYRKTGPTFKGGHGIVKHSYQEHARGTDHVNTCESFFALLKRGVYGTFHAVSRKHVHRYASEFAFRWNTRRMDDGARIAAVIKASNGKRLMYKTPVKKENPPESPVDDKSPKPIV